MAVLSLRLLLIVCCCAIQLSSARGVQASKKEAGSGEDVAQVSVTSAVHCKERGCDYDLQLYCLNNGVIVMGSCSLKNTLCTMVSQHIGKPFALHHIDRDLHLRMIFDQFIKAYAQSLCDGEVLKDGKRNDLRLADNWDSCFLATYTVHHPNQMVMVQTENAPDNGDLESSDVTAGHLKLTSQAGEDGSVSAEANKKSAMAAELVDKAGDTKGTAEEDQDMLDLQLEEELMTNKVKDEAVRGDNA